MSMFDDIEETAMADAARRSEQKVCPDCKGTYYNNGAHAEECPGPMEFVGFQCYKCLEVTQRGEKICWCGGTRHPIMGVKRREPAA